jgi:hypothetical protein
MYSEHQSSVNEQERKITQIDYKELCLIQERNRKTGNLHLTKQVYATAGDLSQSYEPLSGILHKRMVAMSLQSKRDQRRQNTRSRILGEPSKGQRNIRYEFLGNTNVPHAAEWPEKLQPLRRVHVLFNCGR